MNNLFSDIDLAVYNRTSIYRCTNTLNPKSNLYKIPLDHDQISSFKSEDILEYAKKQRTISTQPIWGDGELEDNVIKEVPKIRVMESNVEPRNIVPCV